METLIEQLDSCYSLTLENYYEPEVNDLCLCVIEDKLSPDATEIKIGEINLGSGRLVETQPDSRRFRIFFRDYVGFAVLNESYSCAPADDESYSGGQIREYTASRYLEHIKLNSYASDEHPGKLRHFEVVCSDHIINVVSESVPEVSLVAP